MAVRFKAGDRVRWTQEAQDRAARSRDMYDHHLVVPGAVGVVEGHWQSSVMVKWGYTGAAIPCNPNSLEVDNG